MTRPGLDSTGSPPSSGGNLVGFIGAPTASPQGPLPTPTVTTSAPAPSPSGGRASAPVSGPPSAVPAPPGAPGSNMTERQWVTLLLQYLGAPITENNIDNVMRWMTAEEPSNNWFDRNNPLNASVGTGTVDGTGSYATLEIGAQYTAGMIKQQNMSGIYRALMSDADPATFSYAVVSSPWAASHYGVAAAGAPAEYVERGRGTNYIATIPVPGGNVAGGYSQPGSSGATSGGGGGTGGGTVGTEQNPASTSPVGPNGQPLTMADIPAVQDYIRKNYGTDSWLLDIPEVANVLENAVVSGESEAQIQAAIQQTTWWKTTSQAVKTYEQNQANNPADYSFSTPGSTANQTLAQIQNTAGQIGIKLDPNTAQSLAQDALKYGWTSNQIQQAIGAQAAYSGPNATNAGTLSQQLQALAGQYLMTVSPQTMQSWIQNIAAGTQSTQQFQAYLAQAASLKWTGMASQIQQGYTPYQITDSLRNEAAKTMEVDPTQVDFVQDPTYQKILDYAPPAGSNGVSPSHRMMTLSEMDQYLKSLPQWGYTQQARDSASTLEQQITQTFGKMG